MPWIEKEKEIEELTLKEPATEVVKKLLAVYAKQVGESKTGAISAGAPETTLAPSGGTKKVMIQRPVNQMCSCQILRATGSLLHVLTYPS